MVALLTVVSVLSMLASQATALTPGANVLSGLLPRQIASGIDPSAFPAQCRSGCTSTLTTIDNCTDMTCICSASNISGLQSCINCIVSTAPTADVVSEGQSVLSAFNHDCAGTGVASLTIGSTSGASATSSSVSATASSSGLGSKNAAGKVSAGMIGFIGAGIVGAVVAVL